MNSCLTIKIIASLTFHGIFPYNWGKYEAFLLLGENAEKAFHDELDILTKTHEHMDRMLHIMTTVEETAWVMLKRNDAPKSVQSVANSINDGVLHADLVRAILRHEYKRVKNG